MSRLVVGLGSSRGVPAAAVTELLDAVLADPALAGAGGTGGRIAAFATIDRRRGEPGLLAAVRAHGAPLHCYPAAELDAVTVPNPSAGVRDEVGTASVAEAAALLGARDLGGGSLLVPKRRGHHVTVAVAVLDPVSVDQSCTACGACLLTCPEAALRPAPGRPAVVATRCTSCGECVEVCPTDAISLHGEPPRPPLRG